MFFFFAIDWFFLLAAIRNFFRNEKLLADEALALNQKANGYRGIWYMNQPSRDEYLYNYSGGLGTYCAKHKPLAVDCSEVDKTFIC